MRLLTFLTVFFVSLTFAGQGLYAAEFHVKQDGTGDFTTIQAAIDAAVDGDTVIVHPGTYYENIQFKGKNIVLRSLAPEDEQIVTSTIVDGGQKGSVVTFKGREDESCLLAGLTITNGHAENGGGIRGDPSPYGMIGTKARITNCYITANEADQYGGGLLRCRGPIDGCLIAGNRAMYGAGVSRSDGIISNCSVRDNVASFQGGGFYECGGTIEDCTVCDNLADDYGGGFSLCEGSIIGCTIRRNRSNYVGGGIVYGREGELVNCTITENWAAAHGGGLAWSTYSISNCVISDNTAGETGGGIAGDALGTLEHCWIFRNSAPVGGGVMGFHGTINECVIGLNTAENGGGLASCNGTIANSLIGYNSAEINGGGLCWCRGTITNCTIVENRADQNGGGLHDCTADIANCIIWDNDSQGQAELNISSTPSYSCIRGWTDAGQGNISDDPSFVRPENADYLLQAASPCINSGDDSAAFGETDLDGNPRVVGLKVDMGTYEYNSGCSVTIRTDRGQYHGTETMILSASGVNYGASKQVDLYAAILTCSGDLLFVPSLSAEWSPWVSGLELTSDSQWGPEHFAYQFSTFECSETIVAYSALFQHDSMIVQSNLDTWVFHYDRGYNIQLTVKQDDAGDFTRIQQAMCCAIDGDTITVYPGIYYENVNFGGKSVVLTSVNPFDPEKAASTIIDGRRNGSVISFDGTEDDTCAILGLTVTNGLAENGGGIYSAQSGPSGYYARSYAQIKNCIISNNVATASGGGIYFCGGAIEGCTIVGNEALYGGGLNDCHKIIKNCVIQGNRATADAGGLGYCPNLELLQNCLVTENIAAGEGGGLHDLRGLISNCTIASNTASVGGGISELYGGMINCIMWGNEASIDSQLHNSSDASYSCIEDYSGGVGGCITDDPQFVSGPLGHYYLDPLSPCIDAGWRSAGDAGLSDRTTQRDGTPDTGIVDMGFHYPLP